MNKGFLQGTPFYIESGDKVVKTFNHKGNGIRITLSNNIQFVCGSEQELFDYDNNCIEAINSLNTKLYNGLEVINIEEIGEVELYDISVLNDEHYFYISINDCDIKVHNLNIGRYLGGATSSTKITNTSTKPVADTTIYIPATTIQFTVSMLKPNTRFYAFFDGKNVNEYIKPTGLNQGDAIITDDSGYISGDFLLPNKSSMRFIAGQREFLLTESPNGDKMGSYAISTYSYTGNSDNPDNPSLDATTNDDTIYAVEPLIQSFVCGETGGMFLSKVGLYFASKDFNSPLLLQIREVINDKISTSYLPGSSVTLYPKDIITSTNALNSEPTWVEFGNPIYLSEGKEYALFLVTNGSNYIMHMVDYGQQTNNITASKDISSRSLIKYVGANNYIRDNSRGIKYILQKCKFDTSNTYTLSLGNYIPRDSDGKYINHTRLLLDNSLKINKGTNTITVTDPNHSFNVGSFVTISGVPVGSYGSYIDDAGVQQSLDVRQINGLHEIIDVTWNTYTFDNYYDNNTKKEYPQFTINEIFGKDVYTDYDVQYDNLVLNINDMLLTGSSLKYNIKGISGKSIDGYEIPYVSDIASEYIEPKTIYKTPKVRKIASLENSIRRGFPNNKSLQVEAIFKTDNENISPIIDKYNSNIITVENLINNKNSNELSNTNNDACARMIFKTVNLYEQATGLNISFYGSVQANTNVSVYYKILEYGDTSSIDDKEWVLMEAKGSINKSLNEDDFQLFTYQMEDTNKPFSAFKIKLVMNSNDSTKVPLIRKFAAVAFAQ